jgi:molybdopterin-binding protein
VSTFGMSEVADLMGVSIDTVRRWTDSGRLASSRDERGHRVVPGPALAQFALEMADQPETNRVVGASTRNRLRGIVVEVVRDSVMAQVEIQAGPYRVVSLMSREGADQIGLQPGMLAIATFKATNVVAEIPQAR